MSIATYKYTDFDGQTLTGECQVRENSDGLYVMGIVGPGGCSKTFSPAIRSAINDLLGGRTLIDYKVQG